MDKIVKEKQNEQKSQVDLHAKMAKKQQRMLNLKVFRGNPPMPRSEKVAFKPKVQKKDNMDQQTKDEKEYLGTELFGILKVIKTSINNGTMQDEDLTQP